ncbi:Endonuclease/exonuclease/phosphatase, partial [Mycena floridula]
KWQDIHRIIKMERIGILGVFASHLSPRQTQEIQNSFYGERMKIYSTIDPEHPDSAGVAVVLNKELTNTQGVKVWYLIPGRAILMTIPWHGKETITILFVYPPNDTMTNNAAFWRQLIQIFLESDIPIPDSMMGDMNVTEDKIDRLPEHSDDTNAVVALAALKTLLGLKDGWREANKGVKEFTHTHHGEHYVSLSRLDRIYVKSHWLKRCRDWNISDAFAGISDHKMVTVRFSSEVKTYQGKGRYMMQHHSIKNSKFMDQIVAIGRKLQNAIEIAEETNPADTLSQMLLESFKDDSINIERDENKTSVGASRAKFAKLFKARKDLLN